MTIGNEEWQQALRERQIQEEAARQRAEQEAAAERARQQAYELYKEGLAKAQGVSVTQLPDKLPPPPPAAPVINVAAPEPPKAPVTPPAVVKEPDIKVTGATTGADKFSVVIKTPTGNITSVKTRAELEARGVKIPERTELAVKIGQDRKAGMNEDEINKKYYGQTAADKLNLTTDELYKSIRSDDQQEMFTNFKKKYGFSNDTAMSVVDEYIEAVEKIIEKNPGLSGDYRAFLPEKFKRFTENNPWFIRDIEAMAGMGKGKFEGIPESIAWRKLNEANKKNPKILTTINEGGKQWNVLNLEEAAEAGLDAETLNLTGRTGVDTIVKANKYDRGTYSRGGYGGITQEYLNNIPALTAAREKFEKENVIIGDQSMPKDEFEKLDPKYQAIARGAGFDSMNKAIKADYDKDYITVGNQSMLRSNFNRLDKKYQDIALRDGFDKMTEEYEKDYIIIGDQSMPREDFDKLEPRYQDTARKSGFTAMQREIYADNFNQEVALFRLKDAKNADGTYDTDKLAYIVRTQPEGEEWIKKANFQNGENLIADLKKVNNQPWVKKTPEEILYDRIKDKYGVNVYDSKTSPSKIVSLINKDAELKALSDKAKQTPEAREKPELSLESFQAEFLKARNITDNPDTNKLSKEYIQAEQYKLLATAEYNRIYGVGTAVGSQGVKTLTYAFSPSRALYPEVKIKEISGLEWAAGTFQVGLFAIGGVEGAVGKVIGSGARFISPAFGLAAGGVFTADTVKNWENMTPYQREVAVTMDTLVIAGSLAGVKGTKGTINKAANTITNKIGNVKVSPEVKAYNTAYNVTDKFKNDISGYIKQQITESKAGAKLTTVQTKQLISKVSYKLNEAIDAAKTRFNDSDLKSLLNGDTVKGYIQQSITEMKAKPKLTEIQIKQMSDKISYYTAQNIAKLRETAGKVKIKDAVKGYIEQMAMETKAQTRLTKLQTQQLADKVSYYTSEWVRNLKGAKLKPGQVKEAVKSYIDQTVREMKAENKIGQMARKQLADKVSYYATEQINNLKSIKVKVNVTDTIKGYIDQTIREAKARPKLNAMEYKQLVDKLSYKVNEGINTLKSKNISLGNLKKSIDSYLKQTITELKAENKIGELARKQLANKIAYKIKTGKLITKAFKQGYQDASMNLKYKINDLSKAIKNNDVEAVKQVGRDIENIGKNTAKADGGEIISQKGKFIQDRAGEIVKIAEKRLKASQINDITGRMRNNLDFVESPSQKVIAKYENLKSQVDRLKQRIANQESLARRTEMEIGSDKPSKPSNLSPEQKSMRAAELQNQISQDTANLSELQTKGGQPFDIQRVMERLQKAREELASLEGKTPGADKNALARQFRKNAEELQKELYTKQQELNDFLIRDKATAKWGKKIAGQEPKQPTTREELTPREGKGGGSTKTAVKEKVEVKPKTEVKEKIKQVEPDLDKLIKAKEKVKQEVTQKTQTTTKTTTRTSTPAKTPVQAPNPGAGPGRWAVVWENGRIYTKWVEGESLPYGVIRTSSNPETITETAQRLKELLKTKTLQEAITELKQKYPGEDVKVLPLRKNEGKSEFKGKTNILPKENTQTEINTKTKTDTIAEPKTNPTPVNFPYPEQKEAPKTNPKPEPEKVKPPVKTKTDTDEQKKRPDKPTGDTPDRKRREFLNQVEGFVARRRGELNNKSMWIISYYPYGPKDKTVVFGKAPTGAKLVTGKGSMDKSATLIKGVPPKTPIYEKQGAFVDKISAKGKDIKVESRNITRRKPRPVKMPKMIDQGDGIIYNQKTGRGHLKI